MAKTQASSATSFTSASIAAGADGTGTAIDVTTSSLIEFQVKVTSGATAPTVAPSFRCLASSDNSLFDADVSGMRYYEPENLAIPTATNTYYKNIVLDVTGISFIKPIQKNSDGAQSIVGEIKYRLTSF